MVAQRERRLSIMTKPKHTAAPMLATLLTRPTLPDAEALAEMSHVLVVLSSGDAIPRDCPERPLLLATLARRRLDAEELGDDPVAANTAAGGLRVWLMLDKGKSTFENLTLLREGLKLLLDEEPVAVDVLICGKKKLAGWMADLATYVALANGAPLPNRKQKDAPRPLEALYVWGTGTMPGAAHSLAEGNQLARILTVLPPNELTPAAYLAARCPGSRSRSVTRTRALRRCSGWYTRRGTHSPF